MGFFTEAFDLIDTAGGLLPSGTGSIGDLTGQSGAEAALAGAQSQSQSSREALEETRIAREEGRRILQPFVDVGTSQAGIIGGLPGQVPQAPGSLSGEALLGGLGGLRSFQQLSGETSGISGENQAALNLASSLGGQVSDIQGLDPNVLQSPFFQALQDEATRNLEASAAARGRVGAGGTKDAIARQSLLLGQQFGQQDLESRLRAQGQQFGQATTATGLNLNQQQQDFLNRLGAQGQRFEQLQSTAGFGQGAQGQFFGQSSQASQQDFANQLAAQQQEFGQRQNLLNIGQASAAGVGAQGLQSSSQASGLLTGIGNAQAAGGIGAANALAQGSQNAVQIGGTLLGAFSDRRLKTNIKFKGKTPAGNNWYSYDYIWGESSEGVMADEVRHIEGAVIRHESGFDMVNYGVIK